ncbi:hypothetical protein BOX15_Mlig026767g2 [Macrostomum lignano]|uniref:Neur_chan_LBD domain-containing protein n=1 Tax=Macrostomum lignano TaxID=282301 RepID=A0A267DU95_9PLAT|nr:hypothetical protein BOX15_Mlig026767g2 [Macrostomum lignano]
MHLVRLVLLLVLPSCISVFPSVVASSSGQLGPKNTIYDGLLAYLFENETTPYKANAMPICELGKKLKIQQDMLLIQLFDLDEPTQMLTVDVWVESTWKDCRLTWDPKRFNNIDNFVIKAEEIWYPDLIFYESLHGNFEEGMFIYGESKARIFSDGSIQLGAQAVFKSFCRINIAQFPYDRQRCNITFSSWTKDTSNFLLVKKEEAPGKKEDHAFVSASNGEWMVEGFPSFDRVADRKVGLDEASGRSRQYSEVAFQLRLKRKYMFQQVYMLFPCMLLTWLTLFVFIMPTECGEKIAYVTTILLSLMVFLLMVSDNIPRSGDAVPVLGIYFCIAIALVSLANIKTIISYNISLKGKDFCMPACFIKILESGKYVGLPLTHHNEAAVKVISFAMKPRQAGQNPVTRHEDSEVPLSTTNPESHFGQDENKWRFLGIILDRVFLIIYFVLNLAVSIWILTRCD